MADFNPLAVVCPDCLAAIGVPCRTSVDRYDGPHMSRVQSAHLRSVQHGTCSDCGRPMVYGRRLVGDDDVAWHHLEADAAVCPPLPDPRTNWNGYALALQSGLAPGQPGTDRFIPVGVAAPAP